MCLYVIYHIVNPYLLPGYIYIYVCNITLLGSSFSEHVWVTWFVLNSVHLFVEQCQTEYHCICFSKMRIQSLHLTKEHCHKGMALFFQWKAILLLCNDYHDYYFYQPGGRKI